MGKIKHLHSVSNRCLILYIPIVQHLFEIEKVSDNI